MDRKEVITRLKATEPQIRALGVDALYLYGSYASDSARSDSDIDVLVDFGPESGKGLTAFMMPYQLLEDQFPGVEISYGTRESISPAYRASVEQSAIRVF